MRKKSPNAVAVLSGNASNGTELIAATIDAPVEQLIIVKNIDKHRQMLSNIL